MNTAFATAFAFVRAVHFASLMTVFGASALLFQAKGVDAARFSRLLFAASLAALATAVLWLFFVTQEIAGDAAAGFSLIGDVATKSFFGHVAICRFVFLIALCVVPRGWHAARTLLAAAALVLLGPTSHAAAAGAGDYFYARAAIDVAHLLAAGFWLGGLVVLVPLVLAKPRDTPRLIALLRMFSRWGTVSVAVLIVTGTLNAVAILDVQGMRWSSTYVTWLSIKIVLAAVMVALALTNRFGVLPGLERGEAEAAETIPLTVLAELGAAVLIVLIVGFLGLEPPMAM